jgi:hypothetical protein
VEEVDTYGKEYKKYCCIVIGRTLVFSMLEETTKLQAMMSEESFKAAKCSYVDATCAFDKKMGDVIYQWRCHLCDAKSKSWKILRRNDDIVYTVVGKVTRYM